MTNRYCDALGIDVPRLEKLRGRRDATTFSLFLVALLERGGPMTLAEVAARFEEAGIAPAAFALASLKRCRPGRPPAWRDGGLYALDPHDDDLDLRIFMLGLRPPKVRATPPAPRVEPEPLPGSDQRLAVAELDEAWKEENLWSWARQRLVLAVLDAHARPMRPGEVVVFLSARAAFHGVTEDAAKFLRPRSPVDVLGDGRWAIGRDESALRAARAAVRERLALRRRWARQPDAAAIEAAKQAHEVRRAAHAAELLRLRRVIVHAFPARQARAVVLLDVGTRAIDTFVGGELAAVTARLDAYDVIAAIDVRALLRGIGYDPREQRLADLGPPQKTMQLNRRGRTLRITTELLIHGSCGISRPLGTAATLRAYLAEGSDTRLRRRLEADAKALYALYRYGRLHGAVRLRWGFLDEHFPAPWVHHDEPKLYELKRHALEVGVPLEVVAGSAPGWGDPWSRAQRCMVAAGEHRWQTYIVADDGQVIDDADVQIARIVASLH